MSDLKSNKRQKLDLNMFVIGSSSTGSAFRTNLFNNIKNSVILSTLPITNSNIPVIGTHDGSFHCDEALAIGLLKMLPRYAQSPIIRTRNPTLLASCDIVVDVGATYEPEKHRYDHHQREFIGTLDNLGYNTKLSSAGLVYKHFGEEILGEIISETQLVPIAYNKIYKNFIEHVDAIDNGISINDLPPKYHVSTTLSSRVGTLNPAWNEDSSSTLQNERFQDAVLLTSSEFLNSVEGLSKIWWPARSLVIDAVNERHQIHESGKIIVLNHCPWKDHLFELENEVNY